MSTALLRQIARFTFSTTRNRISFCRLPETRIANRRSLSLSKSVHNKCSYTLENVNRVQDNCNLLRTPRSLPPEFFYCKTHRHLVWTRWFDVSLLQILDCRILAFAIRNSDILRSLENHPWSFEWYILVCAMSPQLLRSCIIFGRWTAEAVEHVRTRNIRNYKTMRNDTFSFVRIQLIVVDYENHANFFAVVGI